MVVLNNYHFCLLDTFLDRVKDNGGDFDSGILAIDGDFISSLSRDAQGPVGSAIKILRVLKDLDMVLNALWKAVENSVSKAQKELLPVTRHHGILSLPVEVVARIFRQVYDDDPDCATQSIPSVNHCFRDTAVRTPELWTCLTPCRNPKLYMERSKPRGLNVILAKDPHHRRFLEMVAPEAERWTSLSLPASCVFDQADFKWTRDVISGKTLAALRELCIGGLDFYSGTLEDGSPLYRDWKMPTLRIIKCLNMLPCVQPKSLTCFHLHVGERTSYSCEASIGLRSIAKFLLSLPLLTELSLDIGWVNDVAFLRRADATLPNVKTLRLGIKVTGDEEVDSSLADFLASLRMPNLSDLSVDVTVYYASVLTFWIEMIFPEGNRFWPSLETLDLSMSYKLSDYNESEEAVRPPHAPNNLFKIIPAVRHLDPCRPCLLTPQRSL